VEERVPSVFGVKLSSYTLKMDLAGSFEMFVTAFQITQSHNPEDHNLNYCGILYHTFVGEGNLLGL
jgi:hypothetical protein